MPTSLIVDEPEAFQHKPLDHTQPSIRLIEFQPRGSAEEPIKCRIWHTKTTAVYTCLSYGWGDDSEAISETILLNGKLFAVRQNLYDFLDLACSQSHTLPDATSRYWIDAICIDQCNLLERNHQVAHMGEIFANAQCVHVWLGRCSDTDIEHVRMFFNSETHRLSERRRTGDAIEYYILRNEYWGRAWITQEILLAQKVIVQMDICHAELSEMYELSDPYVLSWVGTSYGRVMMQQFGDSKTKNMPLVRLLSKFHDTNCSVLHDRVFSLFSLCDPLDVLPVDYSIPIDCLAHQVLTNRKENLCFCTVGIVARSLQLSSDQCRLRLNIELEDLLVYWFRNTTTGNFIVRLERVVDHVWGQNTTTNHSCLFIWLSRFAHVLCDSEEFCGSLTKSFECGARVGIRDVLERLSWDQDHPVREEAEESGDPHPYKVLASDWRIKMRDSVKKLCIVQSAIGVAKTYAWGICSEVDRWYSAQHHHEPFVSMELVWNH